MSMRWVYTIALIMLFYSMNNAQTKIAFDELERLLKTKSPQMNIINGGYEISVKEREIDLQWSNPEFEFEMERIKFGTVNETESVYSFSKSFEFPWIYSKRKDVWDSKLKAASYEREKNVNAFLAEMKTGYVELKLLADQQNDVNEVKTMLKKISQTASNQHDEGAISGFEQNLIQMSLASVESAIIELSARRTSLEYQWKAMAGIDKQTAVELTSDIKFMSPNPALLDEAVTRFENYAGINAHHQTAEATKNEAELEGMSFLPELSLSGGYKTISPDAKGFVLGVSVPVPLLNQNGALKELKQIEYEIHEKEFEQYKAHLAGEVNTLIQSIEAYQNSLRKYFSDENKLSKGLDQITVSYTEGWISLSDMLNAVEIYFGYIESVNEQLINYYKAVFTLESISGKSLITF